jgi:spermidine/putrescine transport system ATP-binding protein
MADAPIVRVESVRKSFGAMAAVDGVTLHVARGEFVSLLGPSGCGKTTLLRMIAGFEYPDSGEIVIDGMNVADILPNRRPINMVFQSYALFPHLNVFDNVAFGLRRKRVAKAAIAEQVTRYLHLVGLDGFETRMSTQLSGGQQQRVALARALVNQPKVLLLDEPLGALDLKLRKRMQVELKQLQRELGISFIYVTHDQEEALALSDRIAVMNGGKVLQFGSGREIYDHPRTEFVANFLGEANVLPCVVAEAGASPRVIVAGHSFSVRMTEASALKPEEKALLVVRPEQVRLSAEKPPVDSLPCRVMDKVFLGGTFLVHLDADGVAFISKSVTREMFDRLDPKQTVYASWLAAESSIVTD